MFNSCIHRPANNLFAGTNVSICLGKHCLGAAIGSKSFLTKSMSETKYAPGLRMFSAWHLLLPQTAFSIQCIHPWSLQLVDLCPRTTSNIQHLLILWKYAIHEFLIPALTGRPSCSSLECSYLALPVRLGGLGIANPTETSAPAFLASVKLNASLTDMIMSKGIETHLDYNLLQSLKRDISSENHKSLEQKQKAYTSYYLPRCNA